MTSAAPDSEPDPDPRAIASAQDFVKALKALRRGSGHTIRELAQMVTAHDPAHAVSHSTLGGWFTGAHLPTRKLTGAFVALLVLLGEKDGTRVTEWLAALDRVRAQPGPRPAETPSPFRGLTPYEVEHARYFCGRDALVTDLIATLQQRQRHGAPVIVVGPSGAGKSSLLRAGLIPAWCGADGHEGREHLLFTPGEQPLRALSALIAARTGCDADDTHGRLRDEPASASALLRERIGGASLLVVVDQLEELFTLCGDAAERAAFIDALHAVALDGYAVVYGLRADFFAQAMQLPALTTVLQHGQIVVGPMSEPELRQAINQPAQLAQLTVQPELVEVLLRDLTPRQGADGRAGHEPGALPLLSHALLSTWQQASGRTLTVEHYRATGGIRGAITQTAEEAYAALPGTAERDAARRLFLRLVHTDDETADARRKVVRAELLTPAAGAQDADVAQVIQRFATARLLTVDGDTVEIAHEALLWSWPRLREWLDADRGWLRFHRRLGAAVRHWEETGRSVDGLYRGGILQRAQEHIEGHRDQLSGSEHAFLKASLEHQATQQTTDRRRERRRQQLVAAVVVFALLAAGVLGYAVEVHRARSAERARAELAAAQSTSRQVATKSDRLREQDVPLAQLLALAAYRVSPTPEARSSLLNATSMPAATRLRSPAGSVKSVASSADGRMVAAGTEPGPVQVWQVDPVAGLTAHRTLTGPAKSIVSVAFTRSGVLAGGGKDRSVYLWSLTGGSEPIGRVVGPTGDVLSVAFSPDGAVLAAADEDGRVHLWNVRDPARPVSLATFTDSGVEASPAVVQTLAFTPDGRVLVSGSYDSSVRLWDVAGPARAAEHPERTDQQGLRGRGQPRRPPPRRRDRSRAQRVPVGHHRPAPACFGRPAADGSGELGQHPPLQPGRRGAGRRQLRQQRVAVHGRLRARPGTAAASGPGHHRHVPAGRHVADRGERRHATDLAPARTRHHGARRLRVRRQFRPRWSPPRRGFRCRRQQPDDLGRARPRPPPAGASAAAQPAGREQVRGHGRTDAGRTGLRHRTPGRQPGAVGREPAGTVAAARAAVESRRQARRVRQHQQRRAAAGPERR